MDVTHEARGTKVLRCGAKRPVSAFADKEKTRVPVLFFYSVPCPRRRTLGASPHSVGL